MCGICGKLSAATPVAPKLVKEMCSRIAHRGPDDQGVYVDGNVGLGNRRLAIQDLSAAGHMPMSDQSGKLWITYNGEVYNFQELREELQRKGYQFRSRTDTEVVLNAYKEWGVACLGRFNGMFSFAIWDSRKRELFVARDHMGIKPLYYSFDGSTLTFASETKAMLADPAVSRQVDPQGLMNYFTFGHAVAPDTIFCGVKKLLPGTYFTCKVAGNRQSLTLNIQRYWEPPVPSNDNKEDLGKEYYADQVYQLLRQSVQRRMVADVPVGVFLSGGVDSSAVTGLMSSLSSQKIKTFSVGFANQGSDYNELDDARRVAEHFGTDHHELLLTESDMLDVLDDLVYHYDEPFGDAASFPTYLVSRFARQQVPVALSGEGSDELFGGYRRYIAEKLGDYYRMLPSPLTNGVVRPLTPLTHRFRRVNKALQVVGNKEPISRYSNWFNYFDDEMRANLLNKDLVKSANGFDSTEAYRRYFPPNGVSSLGKAIYLDQRIWLPDTYLEKVDKASMAVSLEARVPFLDHELVELAATIPNKYKVRGTTTKYILKLALKDLLPPATLAKPKHGFAVPTDPWFKGRLKGAVQDILFDPQARSRGFVNSDYVQTLFRMHSEGKARYNRHLWLLVVFEVWCRRYGITA